MEPLVDRIKRLLVKRGHTRDGKADGAWLAKNAYLNANTVRSWFNKTYDGEEQDLSLTPAQIKNICRALDIEPDHLLGYSHEHDADAQQKSLARTVQYLENRIQFLREMLGLRGGIE